MNPRLFPRYNVKEYSFNLFFLGKNPTLLPDVVEIIDFSLSGAKIKVKGLIPEFSNGKICIKYKKHTLYFQSRLVWKEIINKEETLIGLKFVIPTAETFQKWLAVIESLDKNLINRKTQPRIASAAPHASSY